MTTTPIPQNPALALSILLAHPELGDDAMMDLLEILTEMDEMMIAESPLHSSIKAIFNLLSDAEKAAMRIDYDICPIHCQDIEICDDDDEEECRAIRN